MKKKGFVRLFGLASCVALLAGCGAKDDPKLNVKALPETFHLGDVIDLDKFVSVDGSNKTFDVYLYKASREIATLKDHKITIKGEGQIKFKVSVGDMSQTLSVNSIAELREALIRVFSNYSNDYVINGTYFDSYIHNPEYAERLFARMSTGTYLRYGYIAPSFTTGTYEFEVDGANPMSVNPKLGATTEINTYNVFNVDLMDAERTILSSSEGDTEVYSLSDKQIKKFAQSCLVSTYNAFPVSIPVDGEGKYSAASETYAEVNATINKVLFTLSQEGNEVVPMAAVYAKYGSATFLADVLQFSNAQDQKVDDPIIRSVLDSKHIPMDTTYKDFLTYLITDAYPQSGKMVVDFEFGWFDNSGNRIPEPDLDRTIFAGGVPNGSVTRVFTEDAIVDVVDNEIVGGIVQHTEDEVKTVYDVIKLESSHDKEVDPDYEDVYENQYYSMSFITLSKNWPDDMIYVSKINENETPDDPSDDVYTFAVNLDHHYEFFDAILTCQDELVDLIPIFINYADRDIRSFFDVVITYDYGNSSISASFTLKGWDRGVNYKVSINIHLDESHQYDSLVTDLMSELFA